MTTTQAKHTPGPWHVQHGADGQPWIQGEPDANGFRTVATMPAHFGADKAKQESNSKLIAAAPELLATLQKIAATPLGCSNHESAIELARAAIAKATAS